MNDSFDVIEVKQNVQQGFKWEDTYLRRCARVTHRNAGFDADLQKSRTDLKYAPPVSSIQVSKKGALWCARVTHRNVDFDADS